MIYLDRPLVPIRAVTLAMLAGARALPGGTAVLQLLCSSLVSTDHFTLTEALSRLGDFTCSYMRPCPESIPPWACYLSSLSLTFLIYKVRIIIIPSY